jgi:hypothetical protein
MAGAVWLTLEGGDERDPSLRLKDGYAQDDTDAQDAVVQKTELHN